MWWNIFLRMSRCLWFLLILCAIGFKLLHEVGLVVIFGDIIRSGAYSITHLLRWYLSRFVRSHIIYFIIYSDRWLVYFLFLLGLVVFSFNSVWRILLLYFILYFLPIKEIGKHIWYYILDLTINWNNIINQS